MRFEPITVVADTHGESTARNQTGRGWLQAEATWSVAVAISRKSVDIAGEPPSLYGVGRRSTGDPKRGVPIIYPDNVGGHRNQFRVCALEVLQASVLSGWLPLRAPPTTTTNELS